MMNNMMECTQKEDEKEIRIIQKKQVKVEMQVLPKIQAQVEMLTDMKNKEIGVEDMRHQITIKILRKKSKMKA